MPKTTRKLNIWILKLHVKVHHLIGQHYLSSTAHLSPGTGLTMCVQFDNIGSCESEDEY